MWMPRLELGRGISPHWTLIPARLPIPPHPLSCLYTPSETRTRTTLRSGDFTIHQDPFGLRFLVCDSDYALAISITC